MRPTDIDLSKRERFADALVGDMAKPVGIFPHYPSFAAGLLAGVALVGGCVGVACMWWLLS